MCLLFESVLVEHQSLWSASNVHPVYLVPLQMKGKTHLVPAGDFPPFVLQSQEASQQPQLRKMCLLFESVLVEHQGLFLYSGQLVYFLPFQMKGKTHLVPAGDFPPETVLQSTSRYQRSLQIMAAVLMSTIYESTLSILVCLSVCPSPLRNFLLLLLLLQFIFFGFWFRFFLLTALSYHQLWSSYGST